MGKFIFAFLLLFPIVTFAAQEDYVITLKDNKFSPEELRIPANKKVEVVIYNQDGKRETFYSFDLNRSQSIEANGSKKIYIGPLKAGNYRFEGKWHPKTAKGLIIAD